MTPSEVWHLDSHHIAQRLLVFDEVESTNTIAMAMANSEQQSGGGFAVVAQNQTSGRGRFGRHWQSRPGSSLLMSVVLRPPSELRRASILTAWAAVAVGTAVLDLAGIQSIIKWPNDVLVRGKKVCGILIEQGTATVVGIGLNLNQTADEFTAAGLPDATSLRLLTGTDTEVRTATGVLVRHLDTQYARLLAGERAAVETEWKWRTGLLGRQVAVELTDGTIVFGRMREMSFDGLEVEDTHGIPRTIVPETVAHVRTV